MSKSTNHRRQHEEHRQAAELHYKAAHAHMSAAEELDHAAVQEHTARALSASRAAYLGSEAARHASTMFGHHDLDVKARELWESGANGAVSSDEIWFRAAEELCGGMGGK